MDTHMPGVRVTPLSTLLTIQHTHTWPLGSALSNASAAHTTEFPYGPWKWIRRWTSLTSHAPAISSFGCCVVCVCLHTSGGWVRETGWYQKGPPHPQVKSLKYSAHHPHQSQKMFLSITLALHPSRFSLLSPSLGMSLPLYHPSFLLPPPTPCFCL